MISPRVQHLYDEVFQPILIELLKVGVTPEYYKVMRVWDHARRMLF